MHLLKQLENSSLTGFGTSYSEIVVKQTGRKGDIQNRDRETYRAETGILTEQRQGDIQNRDMETDGTEKERHKDRDKETD